MKDLTHVKEIAQQMVTLSAELFRLVIQDETERRSFMEQVKKMPTGIYCNSPA